MANHKKATHHHSKAGACLEKGDHKGAAHHMGHALAALRQSASMADAEPDDDDVMGDEAAPPVKPSLRDRLKNFAKK